MRPGVGAVDDVDVPAIIGRKVVGLNRDLAFLDAVDRRAAKIGIVGGGRDIETHLLRVKGVANIDSPYSRVEVGDEHDFLVERWAEFLLGGMGTKAPAAVAELSV